MTKFQRRAINFDLYAKWADYYHPEHSHVTAYKDVRRFLETYGFERKMGSGYVSNNEINEYEYGKMLHDMKHQMPWLERCAKSWESYEFKAELGAENSKRNIVRHPVNDLSFKICDYVTQNRNVEREQSIREYYNATGIDLNQKNHINAIQADIASEYSKTIEWLKTINDKKLGNYIVKNYKDIEPDIQKVQKTLTKTIEYKVATKLNMNYQDVYNNIEDITNKGFRCRYENRNIVFRDAKNNDYIIRNEKEFRDFSNDKKREIIIGKNERTQDIGKEKQLTLQQYIPGIKNEEREAKEKSNKKKEKSEEIELD